MVNVGPDSSPNPTTLENSTKDVFIPQLCQHQSLLSVLAPGGGEGGGKSAQLVSCHSIQGLLVTAFFHHSTGLPNNFCGFCRWIRGVVHLFFQNNVRAAGTPVSLRLGSSCYPSCWHQWSQVQQQLLLGRQLPELTSSTSTGHWCQQAQDKAFFGWAAERRSSNKWPISCIVYQYLDDEGLGQFQKDIPIL